MNRRRAALGGIGALAAAAGAGWAWRRRAVTVPPSPLWGLQFDTPAGAVLDVASLKGRPLLVNFWATWCPPCVKEMPMLDAFHQAQRAKGWQVLGLAVDGPTPVREFLARQPVTFAIGLAGLDGAELAKALGNTQGGLPFTVVFDRAGVAVAQELGALTPERLEEWALRHGA